MMNRLETSFAVLVSLACTVGLAAEPKVSACVPKGWVEDYQKAMETAQRENKKLFIAFTGCYWCPSSKKLQSQILSKPKFVEEASEDFVLVMIEVPKKSMGSLSALAKVQNAALREEFKPGGIPAVVIADANGKVIKSYIGYAKGTVDQYLDRYKSDFGCVKFSGSQGMDVAMTNVVEEFRSYMPTFRQVFEQEVDGFDYKEQYPVKFVDSPDTEFKADAKGAVYPIRGDVSKDQQTEWICRIAFNAYGGLTTQNQTELCRYFVKRILKKDNAEVPGLFCAWDKLGVSKKVVMRNFFRIKEFKTRVSRKKSKKPLSVDEEAAFMSDAAGTDAFVVYREFGYRVSLDKSIYKWGGFILKQTLPIPHGWTAEEVE